jgi:ribokinase
MSGRVLVIGSVNVDLVVRAERLPLPGETVLGGTFGRFHGGKGGNQAVAAARLGAPVMLVAALGDDAFGGEARTALRRDGVGTEVIVTLEGVATGVALIVVDASGENEIAVAPGANARLTPAHVRDALGRLAPRPSDVVLVTHEIPTAAAREALAVGRAGGARTLLNPAPADGLERPVLGLADVLTPNRGELARLLSAHDRDPVSMARDILQPSAAGPGPAHAILVSLGAAGAVLVPRDGEAVDLPAPVVEAVDATGAGDALNGALAAGLAAGFGLEAAARRAVVAASLSVTRAGAREGMPTLAELEAAGVSRG